MNSAQIRAIVIAELKRIAPEIEAEQIRPERLLREQVDLDSMDWLNFLVALHERLGVEIPETDYARLTTLDALADYLVRKSPSPPPR